ncbi:hypothetical protein SAMN05443572_102188 [Myxococcus fulvus]|uniref:TPR repeat-containing protein n=1 Tax=Myxococcus fulvus TaxID=33 RepID=A0A511TA52_MYXFU|nr:hypothetical protein [Myxococcus fulvus]GEN11070.1 hypothetical protein MFU01_61070 [Myxococcus fulvus]SET41279.1 hypothetical protein SAMN05443572_102188 [Myxococcus fulvus]
MWLRSLLSAVVILVCLTPVRSAKACGPGFQDRLLADRALTLGELPGGLFALEAHRLLPKPSDVFAVNEFHDEPPDARQGGGARETALYEAGAKAFTAGDAVTARARFLEVLALPAEERRRFSTFAAYMLGRNAGAGFEDDAKHGFELTRQLVREGFDDPLGLAVSSLGMQARVLLQRGDDVGAIHLYAEQAAHGSGGAEVSLLFVARALARNPERLQVALKDPLAQRLMATFVWTRGRESAWNEEPSAGGLGAVLDALASVPNLAGADRLAAGAWRAGRFDLAERFVASEQTPLASWVKAKLALRRGDASSAETYLAEAVRGLPEREWWHDWYLDDTSRPLCRAEGERGVLALTQGQFTRAAERLWAGCSWPDVAYVAERTLSLEELQRFAATHPRTEKTHCDLVPESEPESPDSIASSNSSLGMPERLHLLLARRLLREGRHDEALAAFRGTAMEDAARQYVEALRRADSAWDDLDRAEALFAAARLARSEGMRLLGTEAAPDWGWVDGNYDVSRYDRDDEEGDATEDELRLRAMFPRASLQGAEEQRLAALHGPPLTERFHYRHVAARLAQRGAELLPPRSQAYAMMLCHAALHVANRDQAMFERLYLTYIRNGARIDDVWWSFGASCLEPNFAKVRAERPFYAQALPQRHRVKMMVGGGMMLPTVMGFAFFLRRKRRAPSA